MAKKQSLESWIREATTDEEKGNKCSSIVLMHLVGTAEREIHTVKFGGKDWTATQLSELFKNKAESYCQEIPGVQYCVLLAFYGSSEPQARHQFMVNGETDFNGATEGPHGQGLVMQSMRHSEAMVQMAFRQTSMLFSATQDIVKQLMDERKDLRTENADALKIVKELILEKATNHHEFTMKQLEFARSSNERAKWLSFAPALINSITGKEIFPESTADTALVETIANNISEEDIMNIAKVLGDKPQLMGPLMARFQQILKKKREREETESKLLEGITPEQDIEGGV